MKRTMKKYICRECCDTADKIKPCRLWYDADEDGSFSHPTGCAAKDSCIAKWDEVIKK